MNLSLHNNHLLIFPTMKQTMRSLLFLGSMLLLLAPQLEATHFKGAEIGYECLGGCTFRVTVTEYFECTGLPGPGAPSGAVSFLPITGCFPAAPTPLGGWVLSSDTEITPLDPSVIPNGTTCGGAPGATVYGVRKVVFYRDYDFCGITCPIQISMESCCRNGAILNLANPSSNGYEVHTNIWDPTICNQSPQWLDPSFTIIDEAHPARVSMAAYDPDGDSLVYQIDSVFYSSGVGAIYNIGYSITQPLGSGSIPTINSQTGELYIPTYSNLLGEYVVGVSVLEYRDGVLLGYYRRDFSVAAHVGLTIPDENPYLEPFGGPLGNPVGAAYLDSFVVQTTQGFNLMLPIMAVDTTFGDTVTMTWSENLPGATMTDMGSGLPADTIIGINPGAMLNWTPTSPGRYAFNVKLEDTTRYALGLRDYSYLIIVDSCDLTVDIGPDSVEVCPGNFAQFTAGVSGGTAPYTYLWSNGANTPSTMVSAPPVGGPPLIFYVIITDVMGCTTTDSSLVFASPYQADAGPDQSVCDGSAVALGSAGIPGSIYQWTPTTFLSNPNISQPFFSAPAGTYSLSLQMLDPNGCFTYDTVAVNVGVDSLSGALFNIPNLNDTLCLNDTLTVSYAGPASAGISVVWDFNGATVLSGSGNGPYELGWSSTGFKSFYVTASDGLCSFTDSINLFIAEHCVWPGDADNDGVADNNDLLALGLTYGNTGPLRSGASLNWEGQGASAWNDTLPNGVNSVYCDTDGNGIVNDDDTLAISLNYGLTHNRGDHSKGGPGDPPLLILPTVDSAQVGDTLMLPIILGVDTIPADSVYGLAFTINYDPTLVDSGSTSIQYDGWLGSFGSNLLGLQKDHPINGKIDVALTRTDMQSMSGFGTVAKLTIVMIDDIAGKNGVSKDLAFEITQVRMIRSDGQEMPVDIQNSSVVVSDPNATGIHPDLGTKLVVYPQPATDLVYLELGYAQAWEATLYTLSGQAIRQVNTLNEERMQISLTGLASGLYLLRVRNEKGQEVRRLEIRR